MLVEQAKKQIVEKIFQTENGHYVRATFLVVEFAGQVRAKIIKTEPISSEIFESAKPLALPEAKTTEVANFAPYISREPKVSPYFEFSFFVSQPTRAPASV
jgi:hypothetical protein